MELLAESIYRLINVSPLCACIATCFVTFAMRLFIIENILIPYARKYRKLTAVNAIKFGESCYFFLYYAVMFTWEAYTLSFVNYVWKPENLWTPWPREPSPHETIIYCTQISNYAAAFVWSLLPRNARAHHKDFYALTSHHLVTCMLIGLSWNYSFMPIGMLVLAIHDVSDIFLEAAKIAHFHDLSVAKNVLFAAFAVVFFVTRNIVYPFCIVWPAPIAFKVINIKNDTQYYMMQMCMGCLYFLASLHVYWFVLIVKMIIRSLKAGDVQSDIRSDEELEYEQNYEQDECKKGN
mmetsp:Transcript_25741/g.28622  ORF Transcript_25741/g.28622 Transcript_25741/m.28622 type:complete len:293 (+) Transcript_25741:85-963(+)